MEEKKSTQGGARKGAGRKPLSSIQKKETITVFISRANILKFGNKEKIKAYFYKVAEEYENVPIIPASKNESDTPKATVINDEPTKALFPSEQFILEAKDAKSRTELEEILKRAKKELEYFPYQKVIEATKHLFDNFFND